MKKKICPRCKNPNKQESDFYSTDNSARPYAGRYCKECQREYRKERYQLQQSNKRAKLDTRTQMPPSRPDVVSTYIEGNFKVTKLASR
jgi:predicted nucleic-acid-binding Zn-ribbon protein